VLLVVNGELLGQFALCCQRFIPWAPLLLLSLPRLTSMIDIRALRALHRTRAQLPLPVRHLQQIQ
jgi:hypothetical protein